MIVIFRHKFVSNGRYLKKIDIAGYKKYKKLII